jgi:hypothetical protein
MLQHKLGMSVDQNQLAPVDAGDKQAFKTGSRAPIKQ